MRQTEINCSGSTATGLLNFGLSFLACHPTQMRDYGDNKNPCHLKAMLSLHDFTGEFALNYIRVYTR